jgi:hypothetical protein
MYALEGPKARHLAFCTEKCPSVFATDAVAAADQLWQSVCCHPQDLQGSADLRTSACTTCKAPSPDVRTYLKELPSEIVDKYADAWAHTERGNNEFGVLC